MTFDRLSLPIPEDLLAQSTLLTSIHAPSASTDTTSEVNKLLDDFEYHSQKANDAVRQIRAILRRDGLDHSGETGGTADMKVPVHSAVITRLDNNAPHISVDTVQKAFARKPRSLAKLDDDRLIGTALDGTVAIWSHSAKRRQHQIQLTTPADCIATHQPTRRLLVAVQENGRPIVHFYDEHLQLLQRQTGCGHVKPIRCLEWCDADTFVSGSDDHTISITSSGQRVVVNAHTSTVSAVRVIGNCVVSGGLDGRLNRVDLQSGRLLETKKGGARFAQLYTNPVMHPHTLLASRQTTADQFALYDTRMQLRSQTKFGWPETANLSCYVKAAWRPSGNHVVCGTQSPSDGVSKLLLFDIRHATTPICSQQGGERRWLECCFMADSTFVANATDGSLSFAAIF